MTKFQKKKCLEAAEQKTSKLLVVVCCCKTVEHLYLAAGLAEVGGLFPEVRGRLLFMWEHHVVRLADAVNGKIYDVGLELLKK